MKKPSQNVAGSIMYLTSANSTRRAGHAVGPMTNHFDLSDSTIPQHSRLSQFNLSYVKASGKPGKPAEFTRQAHYRELENQVSE